MAADGAQAADDGLPLASVTASVEVRLQLQDR